MTVTFLIWIQNINGQHNLHTFIESIVWTQNISSFLLIHNYVFCTACITTVFEHPKNERYSRKPIHVILTKYYFKYIFAYNFLCRLRTRKSLSYSFETVKVDCEF